MLSQAETTLQLRTTTRELMQIKDAYSLYDTKSVIKFMFEEQHPDKEILIDQGITSDPCAINTDVVVISVRARKK